MSRLTYLQIVNRVLKRITQPEVATLPSVAGQAKIISELVNEAQTELWTEATNWYTLFTERMFKTFSYSAATVTFNATSPATITDSGNGFGSFQSGQTIRVIGSTSNDGLYIISSTTAPTAGTLTLQDADTLTAESAGDTVSIYPMTYPVAANFGRAYHIVDVTNNRTLTEDTGRAFSEDDPQMMNLNDPTHYAIQGDFYLFYYIPQGTFQMVDRYWRFPKPLTLDTDTSDLPLFCENFIIMWATRGILEYMNKFDHADRLSIKLYGVNNSGGILERIKAANKLVIDKMLRFQPTAVHRAIAPPRFPSHYGARYY